MKIPLHVYEFYGGLRAVVHLYVIIENKPVIIKALFDTGSPETVITKEDIIKQRISIVGLKNRGGKIKEFSFGGGIMQTLQIDSAELKFSNEEEKVEKINMPILISINESKEPKPSLIGVDFLLKNKLKFFFDPTNKIAYFESI